MEVKTLNKPYEELTDLYINGGDIKVIRKPPLEAGYVAAQLSGYTGTEEEFNQLVMKEKQMNTNETVAVDEVQSGASYTPDVDITDVEEKEVKDSIDSFTESMESAASAFEKAREEEMIAATRELAKFPEPNYSEEREFLDYPVDERAEVESSRAYDAFLERSKALTKFANGNHLGLTVCAILERQNHANPTKWVSYLIDDSVLTDNTLTEEERLALVKDAIIIGYLKNVVNQPDFDLTKNECIMQLSFIGAITNAVNDYSFLGYFDRMVAPIMVDKNI